jgi:L-ribulokinase
MTIVAGVDFGTASVRVSFVHSEQGHLGLGTAEYPVLRNSDDPDFATQRHQDHCRALESAFRTGLAAAAIKGQDIAAMAVATTGSTVVPVDRNLRPLDDYYLWCDHRAWREAAEITSQAREQNLEVLAWCGGTYSSEWGFAKVLHWLRSHPDRRSDFFTAFEHCDLMVALLCGVADPALATRSACAMGHKWMWNEPLGGLPPEKFLVAVDPLLAGLRERLQGRTLTSTHIAGHLSDEWAARLGLRAGIPIPVGALDAHWDAMGAGCRPGDVVNVIGTSTCIMALMDRATLIPGVSGTVQGSVHPNKVGVEAGLAAAGDLFDAIARRAGSTTAALAAKLAGFRAGQTGLTRFAWDNGDRSVLIDPRLRGITLGWGLNSSAEDELFAAIEGTAFHTRVIFERLQQYGVPITRVIHAGGIPRRNPVLNRVYANVLNMPVLVPAGEHAGLGSAIFAFLAAGVFETVEDAQAALCPSYQVIEPHPPEAAVYERLYAQFRELYFTLGAQMQVRAAAETSQS